MPQIGYIESQNKDNLLFFNSDWWVIEWNIFFYYLFILNQSKKMGIRLPSALDGNPLIWIHQHRGRSEVPTNTSFYGLGVVLTETVKSSFDSGSFIIQDILWPAGAYHE